MARVNISRRALLSSAVITTAVGVAAVLLQPRLFNIFDPKRDEAFILLGQLQELIDDKISLGMIVQEAKKALEIYGDEWLELPSPLDQIRGVKLEKCDGLIRDDFKNDRTLPVFGWVISRTEAELISLLS